MRVCHLSLCAKLVAFCVGRLLSVSEMCFGCCVKACTRLWIEPSQGGTCLARPSHRRGHTPLHVSSHLARCPPLPVFILGISSILIHSFPVTKASIDDFDVALAIEPRNPILLATRGLVKLDLGWARSAASDFKAALVADSQCQLAAWGRHMTARFEKKAGRGT